MSKNNETIRNTYKTENSDLGFSFENENSTFYILRDYLANELKQCESRQTEFFSIEQVDAILEETISKYENPVNN
jgi:hypothetical protein